jgi:hypothetical protein
MELTFNGYQLILTVRRRQPKDRMRDEAPITRRTAPDHRARYRYPLSRGGATTAPTR